MFESDYVAALVEETERFVGALPDAAVRYRGADLRRALARALYYEALGDERLREQWWHDRPSAGWLRRLPALHDLRGRRSAALLLGPLRAIRDVLAQNRLPPQPATRAGDLVFAVHHAKFARCARELALPEQATSYYTGSDAALARALADQGLRASSAPGLAPLRRLLDARLPLLQRFGLPRELDVHLDFLRHARPRAVVVFEGNAPFDETVNQACRVAGIPCICVQQGWAPLVHVGFRRLSFTKMLVWGQAFADLLAPHSPGQRFVATGSHIVGPPTATTSASRTAISVFLQPASVMIRERTADQLLELIARVAARLPQTAVLVREHPARGLAEPARAILRAIANVELVDPARTPLATQLDRTRLAVSLFSTTLFEAAASGAVPIAVNPGVIREFIPSLRGIGEEVSSWEDALDTIVTLANEGPALAARQATRSSFVEHFFAGRTREQARTEIREQLENP